MLNNRINSNKMGPCVSKNKTKDKQDINLKPNDNDSKQDNSENEGDNIQKPEPKVVQTKKMIVNQNAVNEESKILHIEKPKNDEMEDANMISNVISNCVMLQSLDEKAKKEVIKKMSLCKVLNEQKIFHEGMIGFYFYIIKQGKVRIYIKDEYKKTLSVGESFGEIALIQGGERTATAQADGDVLLWCLERNNFKKILDYISTINYEENKKFVQSIPMLSKFFI